MSAATLLALLSGAAASAELVGTAAYPGVNSATSLTGGFPTGTAIGDWAFILVPRCHNLNATMASGGAGAWTLHSFSVAGGVFAKQLVTGDPGASWTCTFNNSGGSGAGVMVIRGGAAQALRRNVLSAAATATLTGIAPSAETLGFLACAETSATTPVLATPGGLAVVLTGVSSPADNRPWAMAWSPDAYQGGNVVWNITGGANSPAALLEVYGQ